MKTFVLLLFLISASSVARSEFAPAMEPPKVKIKAPSVRTPPNAFFKMIEDRLANPRGRGARSIDIASEMPIYRNFYKKYIDVKGMPVAAHADVSDLALQRTYEIVTRMLAGRPDILSAMVSNQT